MENDLKTVRNQFSAWLNEKGMQSDLVRLNLEYMDLCGAMLSERHLIQGEVYHILEYVKIQDIIRRMQSDREFRILSQKKNGYLFRVMQRYAEFLIENGVEPAYTEVEAEPAESAEDAAADTYVTVRPYVDLSKTVPDEREVFGDDNAEESAPDYNAVIETALDIEDNTGLEQEAEERTEVECSPLHDLIEESVGIEDAVTEEYEQQVNEDLIELPEGNENLFEPTSMQVLFGNDNQTGKPVFWCPNDTEQVFHTNMGIIGTMGTGKTQFTKSIVTQLYKQQGANFDGIGDFGILIFDYKGDYNESKPDFVEMTDAKILKPYHLPFNPFAIIESNVFKPLLPLHTANAFKDTLSRIYGLGPKQQNTLFKCIMGAYERKGIDSSDPTTWKLTAPTFRNVYNIYEQDAAIDKKDSLAAAMDKLAMFELFENIPTRTTSLYDLIKGVLVIDLSGYDPDIQSLIVAIALDLFYVQMQSKGSSRMSGQYRELKKMILVDEADNFMSEDFPALKRILKEGREFGVGTILTTQFLKNFTTDENDYNKFILTWVVHNVADLRAQDVDFVFGTKARSSGEKELYDSIRNLTKHHSIIKIGNSEPQYLKDKAFWELYRDLHDDV